MATTKEILEIASKWYWKLNFPRDFDSEFKKISENISHIEDTSVTKYMEQNIAKEPAENLILFLYFCEHLSDLYNEKGIPEKVLIDSVSDLIDSVSAYYMQTGLLGVVNPDWISLSLSFRLFRIGRLQFAFQGAKVGVPYLGLSKNEPVLDVHIPRGKQLNEDEVLDSFAESKAFFERYFPEYHYQFYSCHSWLFDDALVPLLKPDSNILKFRKLFIPIYADVMDSALYFVFGRGVTRENLLSCEVESEFGRRLKSYVLSGGVLKNVYAVRNKDNIGGKRYG